MSRHIRHAVRSHWLTAALPVILVMINIHLPKRLRQIGESRGVFVIRPRCHAVRVDVLLIGQDPLKKALLNKNENI